MLGLSGAVARYTTADLSEFEMIADDGELKNAEVAFDAIIKLLVHKAKVGAPIEEIAFWRERASQVVERALDKANDFVKSLLLSRFYRAAAFLPYRIGDRSGVIRDMDQAEKHARSLQPEGNGQTLIYLENLHPVLESRTKEALWLGDLELALCRALRVIDLDPYDSKAWLELGEVRLKRNECSMAAEAYAIAATLGPPASAVARQMAGRCFCELGQPLLAAFFFATTLAIDPRSISSHDQIQMLPELPVFTALKEWSVDSFGMME
jgi:tetratricopeptide (TPR) repeat protein